MLGENDSGTFVLGEGIPAVHQQKKSSGLALLVRERPSQSIKKPGACFFSASLQGKGH